MIDADQLLSQTVSIATLIGVLIAAFQLFRQVDEHKAAFEDAFAREYRELVSTIPVSAMLGSELDSTQIAEHLDEFYHYFDLCNEQAFLARHGRIRKRTWDFWREGILDNLGRPAFQRAWQEIEGKAPRDFTELRRVLRGRT